MRLFEHAVHAVHAVPVFVSLLALFPSHPARVLWNRESGMAFVSC